MTASEYLAQGRRLEQRILYFTRQLADLRSVEDGVAAVRADRERTGGSGSDPAFVKILERIWEMQERIRRDMELQVRLHRQIGEVVAQLLNPDYRLALCCHYLEGRSAEDTALLLHVSSRTVKRWCRKGLEIIELPEDAIDISAPQKTG